MVSSGQAYDHIGAGYAARRRPDPRVARAIDQALGGAAPVVNVGAGAGSYEPLQAGGVVAVEPSLTMIGQRPPAAAPVLRAHAEALPFATGAFAAGLAVLTLHHWRDWRVGVRELLRVARRRVVIFTWDPDGAGFWMRDYFPRIAADDRARFPAPAEIAAIAGAGWTAIAQPFPVPHDCRDGFMGAYWRRPEAYLDPAVRAAISSLAPVGADEGLRRLASDLASGEWHRRHGGLLALEALDVGYRLVTLTRS